MKTWNYVKKYGTYTYLKILASYTGLAIKIILSKPLFFSHLYINKIGHFYDMGIVLLNRPFLKNKD